MERLHTAEEIRAIVDAWREVGESVALVPTMGNLHQGHMSLVQLAHEHAERVVVTVFVNPTQFGEGEDYETYPRTLANDARRLSRAKVDVLLAPDAATVYPYGPQNMTRVSVPDLSSQLCGAERPGHFDGVTSVVCRLFNLVRPDLAVFGQKDYQQLVIIRRMTQDLHIPVRIIAGQTVRDADGLAMSSRNRYLSDSERAMAPALFKALSHCKAALESGASSFSDLESTGRSELAGAGMDVEYFAIRAAGNLSVPQSASGNLVVLAAGRLGGARLIDNVLVELPSV
jgi:pantoate--beta-alanine ligase